MMFENDNLTLGKGLNNHTIKEITLEIMKLQNDLKIISAENEVAKGKNSEE